MGRGVHTAGPGVPDMLESLVDPSHSRLRLLLEKTMNIVVGGYLCVYVPPDYRAVQGRGDGECLFPADSGS